MRAVKILALAVAFAGLAGLASAAAPASAPKPAKAPSEATKAYCKKLYGKAYMLCASSDHDCKFLAADKWEQCTKTGRWP